MLSFQNPTWSSKKGPGLPSYIALDDLKKKDPTVTLGGGQFIAYYRSTTPPPVPGSSIGMTCLPQPQSRKFLILARLPCPHPFHPGKRGAKGREINRGLFSQEMRLCPGLSPCGLELSL